MVVICLYIIDLSVVYAFLLDILLAVDFGGFGVSGWCGFLLGCAARRGWDWSA